VGPDGLTSSIIPLSLHEAQYKLLASVQKKGLNKKLDLSVGPDGLTSSIISLSIHNAQYKLLGSVQKKDLNKKLDLFCGPIRSHFVNHFAITS
jgi:hypothetical protein